MTYIEIKDKNGNVLCVNRSDGWSIPACLDNTDYQSYLAWCEAGNSPYPADSATPEPADEE